VTLEDIKKIQAQKALSGNAEANTNRDHTLQESPAPASSLGSTPTPA
jgi:hypothetical protein